MSTRSMWMPLAWYSSMMRSARDGGAGVKAQAGVHFGGNAAGTWVRISQPKRTSRRSIISSIARPCHLAGVLEQRAYSTLHRLEDQRRVGRRVLRTELGQLQKVAGVGNHGGELFEGVEVGSSWRHYSALVRAASVLPTTDTPWAPRLSCTSSPTASTSSRSDDTTKMWPSAVSKVYSYTAPR